MAMFEILKPSLKRTIHVRRNYGQTIAVAASRLGTDSVFEFLQTLLTGPTRASFEMVSEKVKSLSRQSRVHQAGLLGVQYKTSFRDQLLYLMQGLIRLRFITTHDDEIIRIPNHPETCRLHCFIDRMKVEVGQQWANDRSLRGSFLGTPSGQSSRMS